MRRYSNRLGVRVGVGLVRRLFTVDGTWRARAEDKDHYNTLGIEVGACGCRGVGAYLDERGGEGASDGGRRAI